MSDKYAGATPGPYRVIDYSDNGKGFISVVSDASESMPRHVCDVFPFGARHGGADRPIEEHRATAALLADAPTLAAENAELRAALKQAAYALDESANRFLQHRLGTSASFCDAQSKAARAALSRKEPGR